MKEKNVVAMFVHIKQAVLLFLMSGPALDGPACYAELMQSMTHIL